MPRRRDEDEEYDAVDEGVDDGGKARRKRGRLDYAEEDDNEDYGGRGGRRGKRSRQEEEEGVVGGAKRGGRARGDDDCLIGVSVQICEGSYKGYWGRVKDVKGSRFRVELESQMKIVEVLRSHVNVSRLRETWRYGIIGMGSEIPMHPYMTTMRDSVPRRDVGGANGGGRGDDDALIGVSVKICEGIYKGYRGRVKGVKSSRVRIELESQFKFVEVLRSHISNVDVNANQLRETWGYGIIPMHPYMTPMRDFSGIPSPPHPGTYYCDRFSDGDSCRICLGEYKAEERLMLIRKCNHRFHAVCLNQWLLRKGSCPVCRTNVN